MELDLDDLGILSMAVWDDGGEVEEEELEEEELILPGKGVNRIASDSNLPPAALLVPGPSWIVGRDGRERRNLV